MQHDKDLFRVIATELYIFSVANRIASDTPFSASSFLPLSLSLFCNGENLITRKFKRDLKLYVNDFSLRF